MDLTEGQIRMLMMHFLCPSAVGYTFGNEFYYFHGSTVDIRHIFLVETNVLITLHWLIFQRTFLLKYKNPSLSTTISGF